MSATFTLESLPILNIDHERIKTLQISLEHDINTRRRPALAALHKGFPLILKIWQRVAFASWNSIRALCNEAQADLTLPVTVPSIARAIADMIYSHVYVYDCATRMDDYFVSGMAKFWELDASLHAHHGADPLWTQYLAGHSQEVQAMALELGFSHPGSPQLIAQARKKWPNPGRMIAKVKDPARKQYLAYLDEWFYAGLSQDTHVQMPGTVRLGVFVLDQVEIDVRKKWRSDYVVHAYALLLAFCSELTVYTSTHPSLRRECRELWNALSSVFGFAGELYRVRYSGLL